MQAMQMSAKNGADGKRRWSSSRIFKRKASQSLPNSAGGITAQAEDEVAAVSSSSGAASSSSTSPPVTALIIASTASLPCSVPIAITGRSRRSATLSARDGSEGPDEDEADEDDEDDEDAKEEAALKREMASSVATFEIAARVGGW